MGFIEQCLGPNWKADAMVFALVLVFLVLLRILWRVQRGLNKVDFSDWLLGPDGKAAWNKASAIGGWIVGSWCMIYTTLQQKVPDSYIELFLVYFLIVIGNPAALDLLRRWKPLPTDVPTAEKGPST